MGFPPSNPSLRRQSPKAGLHSRHPKTYNHIFFQACLNHSLPAVQEYVAWQFIDCGKLMGFAGVRLDVRYLEVYPGERGFDGRQIATTYPEADRISAAAVMENPRSEINPPVRDITVICAPCGGEKPAAAYTT
jgi:hypothetical protein